MATETHGARPSANLWVNRTTTAPGSSDDSSAGYTTGIMWVDETADLAYICVDASVGAAVWVEITVQNP